MLERAAYCKIHPAIGIARVGNSPDAYFVGPEVTGPVAIPQGGYKDAGDPGKGIPPRVKRQAARFRIYAYEENGTLLGEVASDDADITWTVHLVNSKAEGDRFAGTAGENLPLGKRRERSAWRNADVDDRKSLVIDPGPRTLGRRNGRAAFGGGRFRGIEVPLGEIRMDTSGRLLVLGGSGLSASSNPGQPITNYANNDRWHDDVSDGPVTATVRTRAGRSLDVLPAWVIVAPPDFAPSVSNVVTLYDVAVDVALRGNLGPVPDPPGERPSFTRHIGPIFQRLAALAWVQQGGRGASGAAEEFADLGALASAGADRRRAVFARFRDPTLDPASQEAKDQATPDFLPALSGDSGDALRGRPERWLHLTLTQYRALAQWRDGSFEDDWDDEAPERKRAIMPEGLDRAALENCAGGAFYPGIEGGWLLRNRDAYAEPFRLSHERIRPGDVTRRMACPWQADFFECRWHWWPAQRPDEVLTFDAYRRLREIGSALEHRDPDSDEARRLRTEQGTLLRDRASWTRGLPSDSYDGDVAMIERWASHGFVVAAPNPGGIDGQIGDGTVQIEIDRGPYEGLAWPEYFHILTNIEQHPNFIIKAKELASWFFARADYEADPHYEPFNYSHEAFDDRMKAIYDAFLEKIDEDTRMDSGEITWPVVVRREGDKEITKNIKFIVGAFSDKVVKERLRQRAPFNLVDGAWLQRIQSAGPVDEVRSHLFAIWDDEAGNGRADQNHCNVYDTLLRSLNIYMPPITSRKFVEQDLLPSAFIQPVFQLSVSLFPDEFFPELLGMTLYLEWEATPTLTPLVRHYRRRHIDPHFYALHVAIDNITAGHGFLAKEAIKLYLQQVEDEAGTDGVRIAWQRIWSGYVTWATAGNLGKEELELQLNMDRKQIDLSYPAMLTTEQIASKHELVSRLSYGAADQGAPLATYLAGRFRPEVQEQLRRHAHDDEPTQALLGTCVDELNRLMQGDESFYARDRFEPDSLGPDTIALLSRPAADEALVRLNRLLLRDGFKGVIEDMPKLEPRRFPDHRTYCQKRFVSLIKSKAYAAKPLHDEVVLGERPLSEWFDDPERLVEALATSRFINVDHPRSSRLFEAMSFSGPMYKIFTEDEKTVILDWIESLQTPDSAPQPGPGPTPQEAAEAVLALIRKHAASASREDRHADYQVQHRPLQDWFADPEALMKAFAHSPEWVVPGNSNASRLYGEFAHGKMSFLRAADTIKAWIDLGAVLVERAPSPGLLIAAARSPAGTAALLASFEAAFTSPSATASAAKARRSFAERRKLIGMGAVH